MWKQSWVFSGLFVAHMGVACSSDTCSIECGSLPESSSAAGVEPTTPPGVEPTASGTDASNGDVAPALPSMPNTESDDSSSAPPASSDTTDSAPVSPSQEPTASQTPSPTNAPGGQDAGPQDTTAEQSDAAALPDVDPAAPASARLTSRPVGSTDATLGYWEYLPPAYEQGPAPLLVFTHGAAWTGDGSETALQEVLDVGPPNLIATDAWPNERPFVVLAPQNPGPGCFDPADIDAFIRYAVEHYDIDEQRVYLTGQSCGAIGAWQYLAQHLDEVVVAAVLISGDGNDAVASAGCALGRVALWGFHNEDDASVAASGTIDPINTLLACEPTPDVKLTIYPGETEHDAWTKTYDMSAGHDIYSWLLEHVHP